MVSFSSKNMFFPSFSIIFLQQPRCFQWEIVMQFKKPQKVNDYEKDLKIKVAPPK
jgi:hypothetical protein